MLLSAMVTTDQTDYAPGSTAVFTATSDGGLENNFQMGEAVQFQVVRTDGFPDYAPGNAPWIVTDGQGGFTPYENADGSWTYPDTDNLVDGNIGTTWYVDAQYAGAWLQLRATGLSSGEVATAEFTDSSIGTPTGIGTAANTTSGSSIGVTLTAPVTVGNTVLMAIAMDPSSTTVTVSDTAGNTYSKDADVSNNGGSSTSGVRTLIFSAPVTSALASGNVITVTFGANVTAKAVSAFSISGLITQSSARDQVATNTGNNKNLNSGNTPTATTQTHELLFNVIGDEDRTVDFTAGSNLTALTPASTSGGSPTSSITVLPQFRIVTTKGTYSTAGTTDNSARWASALVTYKAALSTVTTLASSSSTSTYGNSVTFTATVTTSAPATETPTGSVEFFDGTVSLGMGTALSGSGNAVTSTFTTASLSAGTHSSIRAVFTGTGSFTTSTSSNRSQVVNPRAITISAAPVTKSYDGTTSANATPSLTTGSLVSGQTATYTESFADRNAGNGKNLIPAVVIRDGNNVDVTANYDVTKINAVGTIERKALTVSGLTVLDHVYDGKTVASISGTPTFLEAQSAGTGTSTDGRPYKVDTVTPGGYASGEFADANVGSAKAVTIFGISVSGAGDGNYTVTPPTGFTGNITQRVLTVTAIAQDKDYDGTVLAQVTLVDDRIAGDAFSVTATTATFADPEVGTDKLVTVTGVGLGGQDAGNYILANGTVTTLADISNLAPVLLQGSIGTTYHENALPVIISSEAIVTDGTPSLAGGQITISITANGTPDDRLGITNSGKLPGVIGLVGNSVLYSNTVIGSFAGGTGLAPLVITLNEHATTVSAQALLQSIHFSVVGDNPSALQRAILFELNDGHGGTSEPVTSFVDIVLVNDAPDIVTAAGTTTYVESQSPIVVDGQITVSDVDSTDFDGGSLSVSIPFNSASTDVLSIRDEGSLAGQIGVSGNTVTFGGTVIGTVTGGQRSPLVIALNAAADAAAAQALARNIQFSNTSTADSSQTRTIRFVLRDGDGGTSGTADREVAFQRNVQAPVINAPATLATYRENAPGVGISGQFTVTDADKPSSFNNGVLTVDVLTNGSPADRLSVRHEGLDAGQIGLNGNTVLYSNVAIGTIQGGTGVDPLVITLNENATLGATQALLRSMTFANISDAPSTAPRTIRFVLTDGAGGITTPVTSDVNVLAVNDDPIVTLSAGALNYTANGAATPVDSAITVTDDNVNLDGGQLIVDMPVNGTAKDRLEIRNEGTGPGQIGIAGDAVTFEGTVIGSFTGGTGTAALVVAFNANATPAAVQALARNITFCNVSDAPGTLPRSVKFIISDGSGGSSLAVTREVNVIAVNDVPVFNGIGGVGNYTENGTGIAVLSVATLSDPDLPANFGGGTLTVDFQANGIATDRLTIRTQGTAAGQIGVVGSEITYGNVVIGSFTGGAGEIPLVISLNAQATQAATQALVRNIMYSNISDNPLALTRTIRFVLSDGQGGTSDAALKQVSVAAVNDASTITGLSSSVNYTEGSAAVLVAASSLVNDADSPDLNGGSLAVSLLAGAVAGDKLTIQSNDLISVAGNVVSYLGKQIGTFTGGSGTSPLIITFNTSGNATVEGVQALLRSIQFQASGAITANSNRTMKLVLKDGDGGTSLGYLETINVINV